MGSITARQRIPNEFDQQVPVHSFLDRALQGLGTAPSYIFSTIQLMPLLFTEDG